MNRSCQSQCFAVSTVHRNHSIALFYHLVKIVTTHYVYLKFIFIITKDTFVKYNYVFGFLSPPLSQGQTALTEQNIALFLVLSEIHIPLLSRPGLSGFSASSERPELLLLASFGSDSQIY